MLAIRMPNQKIQNVNLERMKYGHKVGRNEPCPCGSGKKYKNCCLNKNTEKELVSLAELKQVEIPKTQSKTKKTTTKTSGAKKTKKEIKKDE